MTETEHAMFPRVAREPGVSDRVTELLETILTRCLEPSEQAAVGARTLRAVRRLADRDPGGSEALRTLESHCEILAAIAAHVREAARRAVARHLDHVERDWQQTTAVAR